MKKVIFLMVIFFFPLVSWAVGYCNVGADPQDENRQLGRNEVFVILQKDVHIPWINSKHGKSYGKEGKGCNLRKGETVAVNKSTLDLLWVKRCGNDIPRIPFPLVVYRSSAVTVAQTSQSVVLAQGWNPGGMTDPGMNAVYKDCTGNMCGAVMGILKYAIPATIGGVAYVKGQKALSPDRVNVSANAVASARTGGGRVTPVYGPVPAPAPPPNVYIPVVGGPSSAIAPPPGSLSW